MATTLKAVKSAFEKISTDRLSKILGAELPEKPKNLLALVEKLRVAQGMESKAIEAFAAKVADFAGEAPTTEKAAKPGKKAEKAPKEVETAAVKKRGRPKKNAEPVEAVAEKPAKKDKSSKKVKTEKVKEEKPAKKDKSSKKVKTEKVKEEKSSKKKKHK